MSLPLINEIDFHAIPIHVPSLCIPRVFPNITEETIKKIFEDLELGIIDRIDIISKYSQTGERFNRIFIHFKRWFIKDGNANKARQRLLSGNEIKVIYDEPWFWKVSAYREPTIEKPKTRQLESIEKRMVPPQVTRIFKQQKQIQNQNQKENQNQNQKEHQTKK
jgi:hypothetical protein